MDGCSQGLGSLGQTTGSCEMSTDQTGSEWQRGEPILYIRGEIPRFDVPRYEGERYQALVPDTLDLQ